MITDAKKYMTEAGWQTDAGNYKRFKVMGKDFDPMKPEEYIKSFKINKLAA